MDATKILIGLVIAVLALNVLIVGIYMNEKGVLKFKLPEKISQNESAASNQTNATSSSIVTYKKCSEMNGTECSSSEACSDWISASDSFNCCSSLCESSNETLETTQLFDSPAEDEDLGEII